MRASLSRSWIDSSVTTTPYTPPIGNDMMLH